MATEAEFHQSIHGSSSTEWILVACCGLIAVWTFYTCCTVIDAHQDYEAKPTSWLMRLRPRKPPNTFIHPLSPLYITIYYGVTAPGLRYRPGRTLPHSNTITDRWLSGHNYYVMRNTLAAILFISITESRSGIIDPPSYHTFRHRALIPKKRANKS